jgi:hypothetical protein
MKLVNSVIFLLFLSSASGQSKLIGYYKDSFSRTLAIKKDSTFRYSSRLQGEICCKVGRWTVSKNTISLKVVRNCNSQIYDTVSIPEKFKYIDGKLYAIVSGKLIKKRNIMVGGVKYINAGYFKK